MNEFVKRTAAALGFSACGIAKAEPAGSEAAYLDRWLSDGYQAGMGYMANHRDLRIDPDGLLPGARSIISVALNYYPAVRRDPAKPYIAYYAYGADYHTVVKRLLRQLWAEIAGRLTEQGVPDGELPSARVFTDSAPLLERYWAWKAGLGWIGKNTNLIIPGRGSFFFLGEIVTTLALERYDTPVRERCGSCRRCLEACPTGALERPRCLNANRCLSYHTIENREEIPPEIVARMGNRLYGCDTCQAVCPWNRFARPTVIEPFFPGNELLDLGGEPLLRLQRADYDRIFAHSAVKRAKYEGLLRNIRCLVKNGSLSDGKT